MICDNCKKQTSRRKRYQRPGVVKYVCQKCEEKLSSQEYLLLCDTIMNKKRRK